MEWKSCVLEMFPSLNVVFCLMGTWPYYSWPSIVVLSFWVLTLLLFLIEEDRDGHVCSSPQVPLFLSCVFAAIILSVSCCFITISMSLCTTWTVMVQIFLMDWESRTCSIKTPLEFICCFNLPCGSHLKWLYTSLLSTVC